MSASEVHALFPASRKPDREDPLLDGDATELLESADTLEGLPAKVAFYFSSDRLTLVNVHVSGLAISHKFVDDLGKSLDGRYGRSLPCDWMVYGGSKGCVWPSAQVAVTMSASVPSEVSIPAARLPASQNSLSLHYYSSDDYFRKAGAFVVGRALDLSSFNNSTGPRRRPEARTPEQYGFTRIDFDGEWARFVEEDLGWEMDLKLIRREGDVLLVCFKDQARNGGSYATEDALELRRNDAGLYAARSAPATASCPTKR
jgi:hypothetical protein